MLTVHATDPEILCLFPNSEWVRVTKLSKVYTTRNVTWFHRSAGNQISKSTSDWAWGV